MNILIIGASGYIGRRIATHMQVQGHDVYGLARSQKTADYLTQTGIRVMRGNIKDPVLLQQQAASIEAIIYAAVEFNPEGFEAEYQAVQTLISAFEGTDKPLLFTSGSGVLGNSLDIPLNEESPYAPWPLVARRVDTEKMLVQAVKTRQLNAWVIRPGMVYGGLEGGTGLGFYVNTARKLGVAPYLEHTRNQWPVVHVEDLAALYVRALGQRRSESGTPIVHAVTEEVVTLRQIAQAVADHYQLASGIGSMNQAEFMEAFGSEGDIFSVDQQFSRSKAMTDLDWNPKQQGILQEIYQLKNK